MDFEQQKLIVDNIDIILKKQKMKRSELEGSINVSKGYISRLKKFDTTGNNYKLTYNLLKKIADTLKVSLDYLSLNNFNYTTDESSLIDFFESLYTMSVDDDLYWKQVSIKEIEDRQDPDYWYKYGPLITKIESATTDDYEIYPPSIAKSVQKLCSDNLGAVAWGGWLSLKKGHEINNKNYTTAIPTDDFYQVHIDKIDSSLYLYKVDYFDDTKENKISNIIEAYLVKGDDQHFLCNSIEWSDYITSKLKDIYLLAKDQCSTKRLDENAKKLLNQFNND
jgi:transcriptional regulator with XRE-family HTH domain